MYFPFGAEALAASPAEMGMLVAEREGSPEDPG